MTKEAAHDLTTYPQFQRPSESSDVSLGRLRRAWMAKLARHGVIEQREARIREHYRRMGMQTPPGPPCEHCGKPERSHAEDAFKRGDDPAELGWGLCPMVHSVRGEGALRDWRFYRAPWPSETRRAAAQVAEAERKAAKRGKVPAADLFRDGGSHR